MNKNKWILFQPVNSNSGLQVNWASPCISEPKWDQPWTGCPSISGPLDPHPHSLWLWLCRHADPPHGTSLGCERRPEYPEKTHPDTRRMCKLHSVALALNWGVFFFFLIDVLSKWRPGQSLWSAPAQWNTCMSPPHRVKM